jgi:hypothetical protein
MIPVWVGITLMVAAFLGCLLFVCTYALRRWWTTEVGRNAMSFAACETAILGLAVAGLFGRVPGRQPLSLLLFATFTGVAWWRWFALLRARPGRSQKQEDGL